MKKLAAIRGAVCCENTPEDITKNVCAMCNAIFKQNKLKSVDLVSIQFTVTKEITKLNPAAALRKGNAENKACIDVSKVALFCSDEPEIEGGLTSVIRVMVTAYMKKSLEKQNIYLNGAEKLRPDYKKALSD